MSAAPSLASIGETWGSAPSELLRIGRCVRFPPVADIPGLGRGRQRAPNSCCCRSFGHAERRKMRAARSEGKPMATSLYDLSVPTFLQTVRAVRGFLDR